MFNKEYILSIETSGPVCGVSLSDNSGYLIQNNLQDKNLHDRMLATMISDLLIQAGVTIDKISAVAVSGGPGSFTGLRIGVALAKGLCFDGRIKFIPAETMSAIAYSFINSKSDLTSEMIRVVIHSHKDSYYIQDFSRNFDRLSEIQSIDINKLKDINSDIIYCGPGVNQNIELFENRSFKINTKFNLRAEIIDKYTRKLFNENLFSDAQSYIPYYIQDFVPKIFQEKK